MNSGYLRGVLLLIIAAIAFYYAATLWQFERTRSVVLIVTGLLSIVVGIQRLRR